MIRSMTGFGRSEYVDEDKKIAIEIKSVNHRYSDINIKMPRKFNQFEAAMRTVLKDYIERGKVDVFVTYEDYAKIQQLSPSGGILYYNNTWCYIPQNYIDNWTCSYPYILNCLDFNRD